MDTENEHSGRVEGEEGEWEKDVDVEDKRRRKGGVGGCKDEE